MADSNSSHKPGDKRPSDSKAEGKRPPKVRRFDVKTRVPKAQVMDTTSSDDSQNVLEGKDRTPPKEKPLVVTTIVTKSKGSKNISDIRLPTTETSAEVSHRLASTEPASPGVKPDVSGNVDHIPPSKDEASEAMSVNKMFQTSLELQQAEMGSSHKEERGQGHRRNIVDQLFQDFVSTKMREVDDRGKAVSGEGNTNSAELDNNKSEVSLSMEEINRLLDAEITSIKSRSVMTGMTDDVELGREDSDKTQEHNRSKSVDHAENPVPAQAVCDQVSQGVPEPSHSSMPSLSVAEVFTDAVDMAVKPVESGSSKEASGQAEADVKGMLVRKKPEVKKLGLSIGAESLARIMGNWKNGHILEDGEVASSTDSDGDKAFKMDRVVEEDSEDSEVSGTGSLSDSDRGKDGKAKKKKKHKHKHKKKKKHKAQSKEKEKEEEEKSVERKASKEKKERKTSREKSDRKSSKERKEKEEGSEKTTKESKSKDKKKSSHQKSKSPELFDPWDARSYRVDGTKRSRSPSPHSSKSKHRERSKDRHGERSKERTSERSKDRHHKRHKSGSRERSRKRSRSKEKDKRKSEDAGDDKDKDKDKDKEQTDLRLKIDKNKLRKIAIARALANMEKGKGPCVDLTLAKSGGKSVAELTEFCKRISEKETTNVSSDSEDSEEEKTSDAEDGGFHHPFIMRDPSSLPNIVMNIRNSKQIPILTPQEKQTQAATLRTQFPVSSGTQHRIKESDWVPVTTTTSTTTTTKATSATSSATSSSSVTVATMAVASASASVTGGGGGGGGGGVAQPVAPQLPTLTVPVEESVFPALQDINIGSIISERIQAMRRLEQNPFDMQALNSVHRVNEQANAWAQSKHLPGQFTGTTDVRILTQEELAGPDKRNQAWAKKDQFRKAPPLQGGIGMFLLQKMGWKPGDGLGKDNEGNKEPLMLDVKMDRKGLSTSLDHRPNLPMVRPSHPGMGPGPGFPPGVPPGLRPPGVPPGPVPPVPPRAKDLSGKHPVSALTELCTKRRWGAPAFDLISESGPAHKKMFLFKVRVNGVEYMPTASCGNKKLAKAQAAAVCLQEMGLIPRDFVVQV